MRVKSAAGNWNTLLGGVLCVLLTLRRCCGVDVSARLLGEGAAKACAAAFWRTLGTRLLTVSLNLTWDFGTHVAFADEKDDSAYSSLSSLSDL